MVGTPGLGRCRSAVLNHQEAESLVEGHCVVSLRRLSHKKRGAANSRGLDADHIGARTSLGGGGAANISGPYPSGPRLRLSE